MDVVLTVVGTGFPFAQCITQCITLVAKIMEVSEAIKGHKTWSYELRARAKIAERVLQRLQTKDGVHELETRLELEIPIERLRRSLEITVDVVEECGRNRAYRALFHAGVKGRIEEAWTLMGAALADLNAEVALNAHLPTVDEKDDLSFSALELAFRKGHLNHEAFIATLLMNEEVSVEELAECRSQIVELQKKMQTSEEQLDALRRKNQVQDDLYMEQMIAQLATFCPVVPPETLSLPLLLFKVPPGYLCSICLHPMLDPVSTQHGHTYDRECIEQWFKSGGKTNPSDGCQLQSTDVVDNVAVRQSIEFLLRGLEPFRSCSPETWGSMIKRYDWEELSEDSQSHKFFAGGSSASMTPAERNEGMMLQGDVTTGAWAADEVKSLGQYNGSSSQGAAEYLADQGNSDVQWHLGLCYEKGQGVTKDAVKAFECYKKSAEQGNAAAKNSLGSCYEKGLGVTKDVAKAFKWYKKSAAQGNADAQNNLGSCYEEGLGVTEDAARAFKWYKKSAEQGNAAAQNNLGSCYAQGLGVTEDMAKAFEWYKMSAEQGSAGAQNNLGCCYHDGLGVTKDVAKALEWFRKSAEQGDTVASSALGKCYEIGIGVPKDLIQAEMWYRKSAEQGCPFGLGACYENGWGFPLDLVKAEDYYLRAKEGGSTMSVVRTMLQAKVFKDSGWIMSVVRAKLQAKAFKDSKRRRWISLL